MSRKLSCHVAALAVLASCVTVDAVCRASEPGATSSEPSRAFQGVIVLQDGGTLSGSITRDGERYIVGTHDSEILVAAQNIAFIGHSLSDVYERKRAAVARPTAEAHLEIAEWCLRNKLLDEAFTELREARKLDPRHPLVELLERRIAVAREPRRDAAHGAVKTAPPKGSPVATPQNSATKPPKHVDRFDLLVSDLPDGAVERFTRKVQPVLVNSCATAGCHQVGGSPSFQLDRSLLHDMANRRSTMQNLSATLALINRDQPEQSPLLTVPRRTHGGMDKAVFGPRDGKLLIQLAEWVALVTQDTTQVAATPDDHGGDANSRNLLNAETSEQAAIPEDAAALQEPATLRPRGRIRYGAVLTPVEPRDEFDPEIFNRRYDADATTERTTADATTLEP